MHPLRIIGRAIMVLGLALLASAFVYLYGVLIVMAFTTYWPAVLLALGGLGVTFLGASLDEHFR